MKRTFVYCTLALSLLPMQLSYTMQPEAPRGQAGQGELSYFARVKRYFNIVSFCLRMGAILSDETQDGPKNEKELKQINARQAQEIAEVFINALRLENMPLARRQGNGAEGYEYRMVSEYFEVDRLRAFLRMMIQDYFREDTNETESAKIARYIETFKNCLRMAVIKEQFTDAKYIDLEKSFDNAIAYYKGERKKVALENCITLDKLIEKISGLLGIEVKEYCDVTKTREFLNRFLQKQPINTHELLTCFNFKHFLLWTGCKNNEIESDEESFRGMILFVIDMARNDRRAGREVLDFFKFYNELKSAKIYKE